MGSTLDSDPSGLNLGLDLGLNPWALPSRALHFGSQTWTHTPRAQIYMGSDRPTLDRPASFILDYGGEQS